MTGLLVSRQAHYRGSILVHPGALAQDRAINAGAVLAPEVWEASVSDECGNCGTPIRQATAFKAANERQSVEFVNFVNGSSYSDLCSKCGAEPLLQAQKTVDAEIRERTSFFQARVTDFPMFTLSWLPAGAAVRLKNLVTGNVTVGTGFFSEFSQGFSDMVGAVNTNSGMSYKVNKGEAAARSILVNKALSMGANCVVGVDIDYGTTGNNAATINMQGTAAVIANLADILDAAEFEKAQALHTAYARIAQLRRWQAGDLES